MCRWVLEWFIGDGCFAAYILGIIICKVPQSSAHVAKGAPGLVTHTSALREERERDSLTERLSHIDATRVPTTRLGRHG